MNLNKYFFLCLIIIGLNNCKVPEKPLPYLGQTIIENGKEIHHTVGTFECYNQDSLLIDNKALSEYIYVADFFFTSCPSICPKVMKEMTKINEALRNEAMVKLVSFTIDPKRDNVSRLKLYANNLGIDQKKWYFLTGDKEKIFALANTYFVPALEDPDAPGGFDHSGKIILVDKSGHVRSFSEGTDPNETPKIIKDIYRLLEEYKINKAK
ncbi:MAG: SCO family protein [Saprospiraceae bacterium]|nr:SCO family protein [Saprospiraceae bacterium]